MAKKISILTILVLMCAFLIATPALAATENYPYITNVELIIGEKAATINGTEATLDQAPYTKNGRTLVPFRFLAEALGAQVSWDAKSNTASLTLRDKDVKVTLGSKIAYINGKQTTLDVAAELKGGRTFIPLRFVSEALGATVNYDAELQMVTIKAVDKTGWVTFQDSNLGALTLPKNWTISGDTNSTLIINSPLGTKLTASLVQTEKAKIIADSKATYTGQGYELMLDEPIDSADPQSGYMVGFLKMDAANMDNADAMMVFIFPASEGNIVVELSSKAAAMDADSELIGIIFSMEE